MGLRIYKDQKLQIKINNMISHARLTSTNTKNKEIRDFYNERLDVITGARDKFYKKEIKEEELKEIYYNIKEKKYSGSFRKECGNESREKIFNYIKIYVKENGYSPSIREICYGVYLTLATVKQHLDILKEDKIITFIPMKSRTIRILKEDENESKKHQDD